MPTLHCTEPVCRHSWAEARRPAVPRCPQCGGFWVRVESGRPHRAVVEAATRTGLVSRPSSLAFR